MASKILKTSEEKADDSRLSTLPDGVISHILSFLPTKFAATTSVLSRRWRYLFHSVYHIDLDEAWQMYPSDERSHHRTVFHQFVNRLLLSPDSKSHIQSLRLRCKVQHENEAINGWIRAAIGRHVEELDVLASLKRSETLPSDVFNSKNLRILRLHGTFIFDVPTSTRMPNLVNLHLEYAQFVDGSCFRSGFPLLKHLRLCHCRMTNNNRVLELVSPSLTNLILHKGYEDYEIDLHAPNLECLEYSAYGPGFLEVKEKFTRLIRADIDFEVREEGIEPEAQVEKVLVYGIYAKKLMMDICDVKSLRLMGGSLEALCYSTCPLPTFHNLTTMELGANHTVGWRPLAKFLENSPNLEVLNFEQGFIDRSCNKLVFEYVLPEIVPTCLLECLREIKVGDFCGQRCEFELLAYFLRRGKVLEEIKICSKTFCGWPSSFCEKLLNYRRCSKTCKIVVSWKADEIFHNRCIN